MNVLFLNIDDAYHYTTNYKDLKIYNIVSYNNLFYRTYNSVLEKKILLEINKKKIVFDCGH